MFPGVRIPLRHPALLLFVLLLQGCAPMTQTMTDALQPVTIQVRYTPPNAERMTRTPLYILAADARQSERLTLNAGISKPVLNRVTLLVNYPDGKPRQNMANQTIQPAKAALIALSARLNSLGYPTHSEGLVVSGRLKDLVLYLYEFDVASADASVTASVTLALGKPAPLPGGEPPARLTEFWNNTAKPFQPTPDVPSASEAASPLHAPLCAQSTGTGTAIVHQGNNQGSRGRSSEPGVDPGC